MVEQIKGWRTSSGAIFQSQHDAVEAETRDRLFAFFCANGCNEAQALKLSKLQAELADAVSDFVEFANSKPELMEPCQPRRREADHG